MKEPLEVVNSSLARQSHGHWLNHPIALTLLESVQDVRRVMETLLAYLNEIQVV